MAKKDFKYYTFADFATDEEFKRWVIKSDPELEYFWQKVLNTFPEKKSEILKARELILSMRFPSTNQSEKEREEVLERILRRKNDSYEDLQPSGRSAYWDEKLIKYLKIAAAFLVFIGSVILLKSLEDSNLKEINNNQVISTITKSNPAGRKLNFKLPDGSFVFLNSESTLNFPASFSDSVRIVRLNGEAYFDVIKNDKKPFIVMTEQVQTQVLGTSFNIKAYPQEKAIAISLVEGKVQVTKQGKEEKIILNPNEKLEINPLTLTSNKKQFDPVIEAGWKDGILVFDDDNAHSLIAKLKRWYGVNIELLNQPKTEWQIKGQFKDMNLQQVLDNIQFTHKIQYEINGKNVSIKF